MRSSYFVTIAFVCICLFQSIKAENDVILRVHNNSTVDIDVTGKGGSGNAGWESCMLNNDNIIPLGSTTDVSSYQSGGDYDAWYSQGFVIKSSLFTFYGAIDMYTRWGGEKNTIRVYPCADKVSCLRKEPIGPVFEVQANSAIAYVKVTDSGIQISEA
eukprot:Nk52_evm9s2325 gene=Nk52_evmTU9s2325